MRVLADEEAFGHQTRSPPWRSLARTAPGEQGREWSAAESLVFLKRNPLAWLQPRFAWLPNVVNFEGLGKEIARPPLLQQDGYVHLPTTPGLGIDLDEDALRARLQALLSAHDPPVR